MKTTISWAFGVPACNQVDFGFFKAHPKNKIKVDTKLWEQYCEARLRYEILQKQLFNEIDKRKRDKI